MKWAFYVIVFVYMFYRAVYGLKGKDMHGLTIDGNDNEDEYYLEVGERKAINCKAFSKNQKVEWINPNGQVVSHLPSSRVFASQFFTQSLRATMPSLVLTLSYATTADSGIWECRSGSFVKNVSICVMDLTDFEGTPAEVIADEGRAFTLSCQAKGDPEPTISWFRNGKEIIEDDIDSPKYRMMTKYNHQEFEGLLTIMSLTSEDSGVYTCNAIQESSLVDDCTNTESFNITLYINQAPSFKEQDGEEKVYGKESETLFISCEAEGYPQPTYQWFKKDEAGITKVLEHDILDPNNGTSSILQIKVSVDTYDEQYICRATNVLGEEEMVYYILEPKMPESPSLVEPASSMGRTIILNITWNEEILFDIHGVEVQYMKTSLLVRKRAALPRENDWKTANILPASVGDIDDYNSVVALNGLEEKTEYWMRVRITNDVGVTPWSQAFKASTKEIEEEEEKEVEVTEENKVEQSKVEPDSDVEAGDAEDNLIVSTERSAPSEESSNFYGLFFAGGVLIVAVACTFVTRMV